MTGYISRKVYGPQLNPQSLGTLPTSLLPLCGSCPNSSYRTTLLTLFHHYRIHVHL